MAPEPRKCTACGRLFAQDLEACPFCAAPAPRVAPKAEPVRCATCTRLHAAHMASCPFCAGASRPAPAADRAGVQVGSHVPAPAEEPPELAAERARARMVMGAAIAAPLLLALFAWARYDTMDTRLFRYCSLVSPPMGLMALYVVSRQKAVDAVRAWGGAFYALRLRPSGEAMSRFPYMLPWAIASLPCACLLYGLILIVSSAASGPRQTLHCTVAMQTTATPSPSTRYHCPLPGEGAGIGTMPTDRLGQAASAGRFRMDARRGAFGIWFVDRRSIQPESRARSRLPGEPLLLPGESRRVDE